MCAQLSDIFPINTDKNKNKSFNFRNTLNTYLYHWPLFVIGVFIALMLAFIYLRIAKPIYTVKASVIIKDEKKDPDEKDQLQELELSNQSKLAENEIGVLKSHRLITQVVTDLQLQIGYHKKVGFKTEDLYKHSPVTFKILNLSGDTIAKEVFKIKIKDNKSFFLIKSDGTSKGFAFNTVLKTNFVTWELAPTSLIDKFKGDVITIAVDDVDQVVEDYQKAIDVDLPDKLAPTISLSINDQVEQRGKDVLDYLIDLYNQTTIAEKDKMTQKTLDFLDARIATLANQLNGSEQQVQGFRSNNGLTDISSQSKAAIENVQSNDNKLNEVKVQLNIIDVIEESLNSSQDIQSASASLGQGYPSLNNLIQNLSGLQAQREKLLATTPEDNPIFEPINRQIKTTKDDIKANIRSIKSSLLVTKTKLESFDSNLQASIKSIPVQERQLTDKTRRQSIQENLYTYLLQKREEVSFNYASILPDARIVDYAYSSSVKASGASMAYGLALMLGLIFPAGFLYVRRTLNDRITDKSEIEEAIGKNVFSEISLAGNPSALIALDRNNMLIGEEFRAFRTNLYYLNETKKAGWVSLFTSSISNEGKSFVTSNLAVVLAASGKNTVILELDLRKPKISSNFNLSASHPGISDYILNASKIEQVVQKSNVNPKLDIIGAGSFTFDPSEILEKVELDKLIQELRTRYDYILLDTPPINLVTDAKVISRLSDSIFYIVRQSYSYKSLIPFIKLLYSEQQFGEMNIIFNGVERERYGVNYNYGKEYYQTASTEDKKETKALLSGLWKRF